MTLPLSIIITPGEMCNAFADERARGNFPMLAIYRNPKDYPGAFVVRLWRSVHTDPMPQASAYCMLATSLEQSRALLPRGLSCFGRVEGDDACLMETWL